MRGRRTELARTTVADAHARRAAGASPSRPSAAIVVEVPSYADALSGEMGGTIENAVQLALGGFLEPGAGRAAADAEHAARSRRSTAPTRWAAARRAAAGRWTRCSPPTGSAPAWPGGDMAAAAVARRAARRRARPVRRAGLRLHRPALRRQRRRARRRAGHQRPGPASATWSGWPSAARRRAAGRRCSRPPSGPTGRRRRR